MKILYVNQNIEKGLHGGDIVQMENTRLFLEKKFNVEITICKSLSNEKLFLETDLVHIFNLQTADYTYEAIQLAHKYGKKVILSTIFWDLSHMAHVNTAFKLFGITPSKLLQVIKPFGDCVNKIIYHLMSGKENVMFSKKKIARRILLEADFLLPNSDEELDSLINVFRLPREKIFCKSLVVPNAIDYKHIRSAYVTSDNSKVAMKNYVLQVGAIAPVKNQINVLKAFFRFPEIPLIFIGKVWDEKYYNKLRSLGEKRGNVQIISELPQEQIFPYYKNAACHILPSFRESPGLVSLEALCLDCPIVVAENAFCPIDYYMFNEYATICNPYSKESIRKAVYDAMNAKISLLDENYFNNYSYDRAAEITYKAYEANIS